MNIKHLPDTQVPPKTHKLHDSLNNGEYKIFDLGSGCLMWRTKELERIVLFYDPSRVVIEFFVGGGSTIYTSDIEHVPRMVVDSDFSKAQMKRAHPSPYFSGRYALEWHGRIEPMEVPFPAYMDQMCVVATIRPDGYVEMRQDGSIVPQLERASNLSDIVFINSTSKPSDDTGLVVFLSGIVGKENLAALVDRMSRAYDLRMEKGEEKPYKPLHLFGNKYRRSL